MGVWQRHHGLGLVSPQFSSDYHLNRPVKCPDCGTLLHKTRFSVLYGHRCDSCYAAWTQAQAAMASHVAPIDV